MLALYNELDRYPVAWLRNLIDAGHVAPGRVDARSITDLCATDLRGVRQFHAFAGIGVWSYALRLAGWADDRAVWTASLPCQGFSTAGLRRGFADERHLWPVYFELLRECRPPVLFGEQVASPDGLRWFAVVRADLEGQGYAVGAAAIPAAGVGAPHIRERLYFVAVADAHGAGLQGRGMRGDRAAERDARACGVVSGMANDESSGRGEGRVPHNGPDDGRTGPADGGGLVDPHGQRLEGQRLQLLERQPRPTGAEAAGSGEARGRMGDTDREPGGRDGRAVPRAQGADGGALRRSDHGPRASGVDVARIFGAWNDAEWIACTDGKSRPAQPGSFPLAHGTPTRVGRDGTVEARARRGELKGYGNGLCAPQAAAFILAAKDVIDARPA